MFPAQGMAAPDETSYEEHISLLQGFKSHSYSQRHRARVHTSCKHPMHTHTHTLPVSLSPLSWPF